MKKIQIILAITTVIFFMACGGGNKDGNSKSKVSVSTVEKSGLTINIGGEKKKFEPNSSWARHSAKSFFPNSDGSGKFSTSSTTIIPANVELDKERGIASINKKKLEKEDQFRVHFGFSGEKDTDEKTPIKVGEDVTKEDFAPNKIEFVTIYHFADGKETSVELDDNKWKGKINISGVNETTISGSIDITDGENTVKGTFSAEGEKSVK